MQKIQVRSRFVRWSLAALLVGSLVATARDAGSPAGEPRSAQEEEIARRARLASWIVARERERARERGDAGWSHPRRGHPGGSIAQGGWEPDAQQARIPTR